MHVKSNRLALRVAFLRASSDEQDPIEAFLAYAEAKQYSYYTVRNYRLDLQAFERWLTRPLLTATGHDLDRYIQHLSRKGLKGSTIHRRQASLKGFFKRAVKMGWLPADPTAILEPPKKEARIPIHLNRSQVDTLLGALNYETAADKREAAIVSCLYYLGARAGELVNLNIEDIDWDAKTVKVYGKGKKERIIPMCDALASVLEVWIAAHPAKAGAMFVSLGPGPHRLSYDSIRRIFKAVIVRAGLAGRGFTPHKMRHTFATQLVNNKVPIDRIQKLLGHASIMTTTVYAHTEVGTETREAMERILGR